MKLTELFLGELEREGKSTRKVLERVPEGKNAWKPHEKSMNLGYLAALVAQMPGWIALMIATEEFDVGDKASSGQFQVKGPESKEALLKLAEESYAKARAALSGTTEEHLNGTWSVKLHGKALKSGPRHQQIADAFNHLAHQRGQLTVYLRLNEAKVPAIYGPSADERMG